VSPDLDLIKQAEQGAGWFRDEKGDRTRTPIPKSPESSRKRQPRWGRAAHLGGGGDPAPAALRLGKMLLCWLKSMIRDQRTQLWQAMLKTVFV
jgi:hypothetical protein